MRSEWLLTLKLGQTFTLPHIQNRCWGRNFRSRPTGRTENWPTSTCHMSPWQSSSIIFKLLSISSVHDEMQVFNTSKECHVISVFKTMVSVITSSVSGNRFLYSKTRHIRFSKFKILFIFCNVIETRLVLYAPFYVKKPAKYWSSLGECFQKLPTWHFVP